MNFIYLMRYATIPFAKIATATALTTIRARSFQIIATHSQPPRPINCKNIFHGYRLFVVAIMAKIRTIDDTHFNHHEKG
tara:strand:+ start:248 stop:484 length:237 start_codon:yes stop_codon:yes gene_type:complete